MRLCFRIAVPLFGALFGCAQPQPAPVESHAPDARPIAWPDNWSGLLGQEVTVDGWAANTKLGPQLFEDKNCVQRAISIDGHHWPDDYFRDSGKNKHVRVTGSVIQRDDMPVY